jgi:hypothetical protein
MLRGLRHDLSTRIRGLSEEYGSWKIIWISRRYQSGTPRGPAVTSCPR